VEGKVDVPGRLLSTAEKARCCGLSEASQALRGLSEAEQALAIWRYLPPAMLAQVLVGVLKAWVQNEDCQFFSRAAASTPPAAGAAVAAGHEAKRRRLSDGGARSSGGSEQ
jgi:hypothetical protein